MSYELKMAHPDAARHRLRSGIRGVGAVIEEDNSPEALQAELVEELLGAAQFRVDAWHCAGYVTESEADDIVGRVLMHAASEWLMRLAEKPPVDTPSPP